MREGQAWKVGLVCPILSGQKTALSVPLIYLLPANFFIARSAKKKKSHDLEKEVHLVFIPPVKKTQFARSGKKSGIFFAPFFESSGKKTLRFFFALGFKNGAKKPSFLPSGRNYYFSPEG